MAQLEQYIKSYFGIIQLEELNNLSSLFQLTTLKKGDYLLKSGKRCDKLSFVQTGLLRIFAIADGKEVTQWISTEGYFSTDLASFVFESPSRWTIQALVDTEIYTITKDNYKKI
jgi:CRP-like cAMP-binding protein